MLLGQLPGHGLSGYADLMTVLPSYTTAMSQFLNRFGPYRLQPYSLPAFPDFGLYAPPPVPLAPVQPVHPRAGQPRRIQQVQGGPDHGGHGTGRGSRGGSNRSGGAPSRGGRLGGVNV